MYLKTISFKAFYFSCFFCLSCNFLSAQINLCEGFYVNLNGDTVKGKVDFQNWLSNPDKINFTTSGLDKDIKPLSPNELKLFKFFRKDKFEEFYVSKKMRLELSQSNLSNLSSESKPIWSDSMDLFLKVLVKGRLTLYLYHDNIKINNNYVGKDHFFIEDSSGNIEELIYKKYVNSSNVTQLNEEFKSQLLKKVIDCSKTSIDEINRLQFKYNQIIRAISDYNKCFNEPIFYEFKFEKRHKEFGFLAGSMMTKIGMTNSDLPYSLFPTAGVYAKIPFGLTSPKVNLLCELLPVFYSGKTEYLFINNDKSEFGAKDKYKYGSIRLNTLLGYTRNLDKIQSVTLIGGISLGYIFNSKVNHYYIMKKDFLGNVTIDESNKDFVDTDGRKIEQGLVLGAKYKRNKIGLDLRYTITNGWERRVAYQTYVKSISLMISYSL